MSEKIVKVAICSILYTLENKLFLSFCHRWEDPVMFHKRLLGSNKYSKKLDSSLVFMPLLFIPISQKLTSKGF